MGLLMVKLYTFTFHDEWATRYGKELGEKLVKLIHAEMESKDREGDDIYENTDNFRVCRVGDKAEEAAYQKAFDRGCCGYKDWEIEIEDVKYKLGFNYGH